jgi:hypothetical protein
VRASPGAIDTRNSSFDHGRQYSCDGLFESLEAVGHSTGDIQQVPHFAAARFEHAHEVFENLFRVYLCEEEIPTLLG